MVVDMVLFPRRNNEIWLSTHAHLGKAHQPGPLGPLLAELFDGREGRPSGLSIADDVVQNPEKRRDVFEI